MKPCNKFTAFNQEVRSGKQQDYLLCEWMSLSENNWVIIVPSFF